MVRCAWQIGMAARRFHGVNGIQQDAEEGAAYFAAAADAEDPVALANFGYMLANGWGVAKDAARAVELFERSAGMGHAGGMVGLGFAYYHGLGVPQVNYSAALYWYRLAAEAGDAMGHYNLGEMLRSGTGLPGGPDIAAALPHLRAAAAGGHFKALYMVGLSHWCGFKAAAARWAELAAAVRVVVSSGATVSAAAFVVCDYLGGTVLHLNATRIQISKVSYAVSRAGYLYWDTDGRAARAASTRARCREGPRH